MKGSNAGAEFSETQMAAFRAAGLQVEEILSGCLGDLGAGMHSGTPQLVVETGDIPVARTLGDYALFRSRDRVRQEIFGDDGNRSVGAAVKKERLGDDGLEKLRAIVRATIDREMPELQQRYANELVDAHVRKCTEALRHSITQRKSRLQDWIVPTEATLRRCQQAQEVFEGIKSSSARFDLELSQLQRQFELD